MRGFVHALRISIVKAGHNLSDLKLLRLVDVLGDYNSKASYEEIKANESIYGLRNQLRVVTSQTPIRVRPHHPALELGGKPFLGSVGAAWSCGCRHYEALTPDDERGYKDSALLCSNFCTVTGLKTLRVSGKILFGPQRSCVPREYPVWCGLHQMSSTRRK